MEFFCKNNFTAYVTYQNVEKVIIAVFSKDRQFFEINRFVFY